QFQHTYQKSIEHADEFWAEAARDIQWYKDYTRVLDDSNPPFYRWFAGGEINTCYNALDYHVASGRAEQVALIYDSPVAGTLKKFTYAELLDEVARFAGVLVASGIARGDRVVIYMPMIPEAVVAMLACARIGAIHSVVFGGFAAKELAIRINDAQPRLIVSASCGLEGKKIVEYKPLLDRAIDLATHKPERCIIYQREQAKASMTVGRDYDWKEMISKAKPAGCARLLATDPLYILYTSGTTAKPKGVLRDNGSHAVALKWTMKNVYGMEPGDVWWAASDVGWVVGHSYIVYAPLLSGCTTVMYEGKPVGTPDPGAFWRVISQHKVKALFVAPTAIRVIKKEDPAGSYLNGYDLSHFKYLFLAGERTDPSTYYWAKNLLNVPVIDHWWQTETGWAITGICVGIENMPAKAGSAGKAMPGYRLEILNNDGKVLPVENDGIIAIKLPLPPGSLTTLWKGDERYRESYLERFPGYYLTGDSGYIDRDGYVHVMGRIDDVIKVAGHRLSNGSIEEVIASHPDVAECAVIAIDDGIKGEVPIGFVVLKDGVKLQNGAVQEQLVSMVKEQIGAFANFKRAIVIEQLPKTRSGKILRGILRKIARGEQYEVPSTIDDPNLLNQIESLMAKEKVGAV
ncbi:MAG: propionyl-CoA synthetase, partial [Chloroflexi bacterium RBG_16_50_9]